MTELLLDTHVVLWWLADDPRLGVPVRERILAAPAAHVSAATTWEVAIKQAIGKLDLEFDAGETFHGVCRAQGFVLAPVAHDDAWAVLDLPVSRTDPFDRLIAATARRRRLTLVTADPAFDALDVRVLRP